MSDQILLERDGDIATVTLNRPEKRNALTLEMYQSLGKIFQSLEADDSLRCVVLRGAGGRAFCAGSDIGEFGADRADAGQAKRYAEHTNPPMFRIRDCRHPTIAMIQGVCVGGGLELASLCDIRICGWGSRFGIPINRLGLTVDFDELQMLLDLAGARAAMELLLEGRLIGAEEAWHKGIVTRAVPDEEVESAVQTTAKLIAEAAPLVNRWHKKFIRRLMTREPLTEQEREEAYACYDTSDYRIGCDAFAKKEKPKFLGN
jgi:enoyl-CoA hydratase/carnithine racemase